MNTVVVDFVDWVDFLVTFTAFDAPDWAKKTKGLRIINDITEN